MLQCTVHSHRLQLHDRVRCASTKRSVNCITCTVRVPCACIARNISKEKGYIWKHSANCNLLATKRNGERRQGRVRVCARVCACVCVCVHVRAWLRRELVQDCVCTQGGCADKAFVCTHYM